MRHKIAGKRLSRSVGPRNALRRILVKQLFEFERIRTTRAKAEALGLRGDVGFGSRVERVVLISAGLFFAPWGWLQWPIYLLAAMAWITVVQRMLFVRRQLRELVEA